MSETLPPGESNETPQSPPASIPESSAPTEAAATGSNLQTMSLLDHLRELRIRLIRSVTALIIGMVISLPISIPAIDQLTALPKSCNESRIIVQAPLEGIVVYLRVALILGLVLATPIILYQVVAYILPALYKRERRILYIMLPGSATMFALGLAFGYFAVLPRSICILLNFADNFGEPMLPVGTYIAFVTNFLLVIGLAFLTPVVVYLLSKLGILTPAGMKKYRRHAILLIAILAAVLTPTPDPFTMFMVMAPMYVLYELGGLLARIA